MLTPELRNKSQHPSGDTFIIHATFPTKGQCLIRAVNLKMEEGTSELPLLRFTTANSGIFHSNE